VDAQGPVLHVGAAVVLGLSLLGFLVGTGRAPEARSLLPRAELAADGEGLREAPTQAILRSGALGSGAGWEADTEGLRGPDPLAPQEAGAGDPVAAVADRAARRAYDGAPPTIPHPVRQDSAAECLACHDAGLRLGDRVAAPMPHGDFASCTQCHVVQEGPMPGARLSASPTPSPNGFVGLASPTEGPRAWSIAPPQVPHSTQNRERCLSCHGVNGRDALKTPHNDRQSCSQCHASSAALDRRPDLFAAGAALGGGAP
jgi:nitrate reductase (cytochrome), electron transfer subunit